jgi:hypothetical protein
MPVYGVGDTFVLVHTNGEYKIVDMVREVKDEGDFNIADYVAFCRKVVENEKHMRVIHGSMYIWIAPVN